MSFVDARSGWAVAADCSTRSDSSASSACESEIYATTDGGENWTPASRVLLTPKGLTFATAASGWLVGSIGQRCGSNLCQNVIMRSEDGGKKWNRVSTVSAELYDVSAVSANDVWSIGRACPQGRGCTGALVHTISGGQLWDNSTLPIESSNLRTGRVTLRFGWVTTTEAVAGQLPLALTDDGGATWMVPSTPCRGDGALASFTSDRDGWLVCSPSANDPTSITINRSTDAGRTWLGVGSVGPKSPPPPVTSPSSVVSTTTSGSPSPAMIARSLQASSSGEAWLTLGDGTLVRVTSQGSMSTSVSTEEDLKKVLFIDSEHGWLLGSRSVWTTTDGGQRWIKRTVVTGPIH